MSRMNEQSQQEEQDNLSGMDDYEEWVYSMEHDAQQRDLPAHKRDGYAEKMYEMAEDIRKRNKEERMMK